MGMKTNVAGKIAGYAPVVNNKAPDIDFGPQRGPDGGKKKRFKGGTVFVVEEVEIGE